MTGRTLAVAVVALSAPAAPAADAFGLARVHEFHLDLTAAEWDKMQAVYGRTMFGNIGNRSAKPAADPGDRHKSVGFGIEYPWARGRLTAGGKTFDGIGVRYKGNGSYMAAAGRLKRNLK